MESKSITRALVELKTLDSRIRKKIDDDKFIGISIGDRPVAGFESNEEAEKSFQSNFKSVTDLIRYRGKLKSSIIRSNAVTTVTINGNEMTVAEAIERKNSIQLERDFLLVLSKWFQTHIKAVENNTQNIDIVVKSMATELAGRGSKLKDEDIKRLQDIAVKSQKAELVDPNKLQDVTAKMREDIDEFMKEVDVVLSESNTKTIIEV